MESTAHMESREHILPQPKGFLALRIAQLVLAVVLLALAGFGIGAYNISYDGVDMVLFSAIASMIIVVYIIVAMTSAPAAYNYWAILGVDIFAAVFWIISFSLLASEVATLSTAIHDVETCSYSYFGVCYYRKRSLAKRYVSILTYRDAMAATSALGGLEFLLFAISIIVTGLAIQKHRAAGGHCTPGAVAGDEETKYSPEAQKEDAAAHQQYAPQPEQQQYAPQPEQQQYPPQHEQQQYPPQPEQQQYPPQHPQQYAPQPEQQQYPPQTIPIH